MKLPIALVKSQFNIFYSIFLILFPPAITAGAATLHVGPGETYTTIQSAIDASSEGDTVIIRDGIYTGDGNVNISFGGKAITVRSENGPVNCIINCQYPNIGFSFVTDEGNDSILSGMTITNGYGVNGGAISLYNSSPIIENCTITGNQATNGGGIYCWSGSPIIKDCTITGNTTLLGVGKGGGIFAISQCDNAPAPVVLNCFISGNIAGEGGGLFINCTTSIGNCVIEGNSSVYGGGIYCTNYNSKITNCTIIGNSSTDGGGVFFYMDTDSSGYEPGVINSILWDNIGLNEIKSENCSPAVSFCNIKGGYEGAGNFNSDPLFIDQDGKDYHLSISSPCIDAGTSNSVPNSDIEGHVRPQGHGYDIGAYEAVGYASTRPLVTSFLSDIYSGYIPFEVTIACTANDPDGEIAYYEIDFGDGSPAITNASGIFKHTYSSHGVFYPAVTVTDDSSIAVNSIPIKITANDILNVPAEYNTIQAGIDAAIDGDKVLVASGTYSGEGNYEINFKGKAITLQSENGASDTVIDAGSLSCGVIFNCGEQADSIIDGFTIKNAYGYSNACIFCLKSSPTIRNNIIKDNVSYGIVLNGGSSAVITGNTIFGCADLDDGPYDAITSCFSTPVIRGNVISAMDFNGNISAIDITGLDSDSSSDYIIDANQIIGGIFIDTAFSNVSSEILVTNNLITAEDEFSSSGINANIDDPINLIIANNTIVNGFGIWGQRGSERIKIINNIITETVYGIEWSGASFSAILNNNLWNNEQNYTGIPDQTGINGNISADPKFYDPANGDYHVVFGSPCIDTGLDSAISNLLSKDFEGESRIIDGDDNGSARVDMGADESMDSDSDALYDLMELQLGTYPNDNDTDDDGMPDGWEVQYELDPFLDNSSADYDNDDLNNIEEYQNSTNPAQADTDADGMPDGWEIQYGLDPLTDNSTADYDKDGIKDLEEYNNSTNPTVSDKEKGGGGGGGGIFGTISLKDVIGYHLDGIRKNGIRVYMPVTEGFKALKGAQTHVERFSPGLARFIRRCFESFEERAESNKDGFLYKIGTHLFPVLGKIAEIYLEAFDSKDLMDNAYKDTTISVPEYDMLHQQGIAIAPHAVKREDM